jgi:hypothetical protein
MLQEMAVIGGTMTIAIVAIWLIMVFVSQKIMQIKKPIKA